MKARHDMTYCINPQCEKKCERHESHYEFDLRKVYSWQNTCNKYLEKEREIQKCNK